MSLRTDVPSRPIQAPPKGPQPSPRWASWLALVALAALVVFFYKGLVLDGLVIGDYDAFVYFYPLRQYAADVLSRGEFPLWNPYLFLGAPFFANVQTAVLYPPNLLFLLMPVPYAFSASIVLHILLAGVSLFVLARRSLWVSSLPAAIAAATFMFSGFISTQVGHVNQVNVSAWLPLLLLSFDEAVRRRNPAFALTAGLIGSWQLLAGHTQEWYFSTVTLGLLALWRMAAPVRPEGPVLSRAAWAKGRLRPVFYLAIAGLVEAGTTAVQVLPTLELSSYSIRGGGMNFGEAASFSLPPTVAFNTLLPSYPTDLFGEYVGYVGIAGVFLAALALYGWRRRPVTLFFTFLAVFGLFMAFGGYNPFFPFMYHHVPGVDLFRVPARWLLVYTLGISCLAGLGAQLLLDLGARDRTAPRSRRRKSGLPGFLAASAALAAGLGFLAILYSLSQPRPDTKLLVTWAVLAGACAVLVLLATRGRRLAIVAVVLLALLLVGDLWAAGAKMTFRHPILADAYRPERTSTSRILEDAGRYEDPGRFLSIATDGYELKETPDYRKWYPWMTEEQMRQYLIAVKLSETLSPNIPMVYGLEAVDGYDGGILPLRKYAEFKSLLLPERWIPADNLLKYNLDFVPPDRYLDMMNVRYVLGAKIQDTTIDNVYYDRSVSIELASGESATLERIPRTRVTSVGIISSSEGARDLPNEAVMATVLVTDSVGISYPLSLRLGVETGETPERDGDSTPAAHRKPELVPPWSPELKGTDYFAKIILPVPMEVSRISIHSLLPSGKARIRAVTLMDDQAGASTPLVLSDELDREIFFDMKLYTNRSVPSRASLVHSTLVWDDEAALEALRQGVVDPGKQATLAPSPTARSYYSTDSAEVRGEAARIVTHRPEEVVVEVSARRDGYLVLRDAYFPGWVATVDGVEVPIERANHLFRAVFVGPGDHNVVFRYWPELFFTGLWLSGASLAIVTAALLLMAARWWRARGQSRAIIARARAGEQNAPAG